MSDMSAEYEPMADAKPDNWGAEYESWRDECRQYLPVITAYYDGEASTAEAARARLHLQACLLCAGMWREWRQSAHWLRASPVPSTPTGYLPRLLVACRLSVLPRRPRRPAEFWDHALPSAPTAVEGSLASRATSSTWLDALTAAPECPVPPQLCSDILARTVGSVPAVAASAIAAPATPVQAAQWSGRRRLMLPSTMALTAMAAFLIMASRHSALAPASAVAPANGLPAPRHSNTRTTAASVKLAAAPSAAHIPPVGVTPEPTIDHPVRLATEPSRRHAATRFNNRHTSEGATASLVSWRPEPVATGPSDAVAESASANKSDIGLARPVTAHHTTAPRARLTRPASPELSLATTVSLTDAPPASHREFDAMVNEVNSIRDSRPDDVRAVVDDYRAALL